MASWSPFVNGFEGVERERDDRTYILWDGFVDGEAKTKRLRLNENTRKRLIESLERE